MSNYPTGNAANVLVGPARILVAPIGSTLPTLDGTANPVTWDAAWKEVGYTDKGVTLAYTPTIKDIMVDESMAAIKKILDQEKATLSAALAESTLKNLHSAISASILTDVAADGTHAQIRKIEVGTGIAVEVLLGFEGINEAGLQRVFIGYRATVEAAVSMTMQRSDKTMINVQWGLIADPSKAVGKQLYEIVDILAPHV